MIEAAKAIMDLMDNDKDDMISVNEFKKFISNFVKDDSITI